MKFANVRELKNKTSELLRLTRKGKNVLITSRGKPVAILHGIREEEVEDYVLTHHPDLRMAIEKAYQDYKKHGGFTIEEVISRLEKKGGRV